MRRCRAEKTSNAGLDAGGKTVGAGCWRAKVLEGEKVGFGVTGPMVRSCAAKSGSRPSRSIAFVVEGWLVWVVDVWDGSGCMYVPDERSREGGSLEW